MDLLAMLLLSGALGLLVTAHVALVAALFWLKPRWRAPLALLVPPFAPYFGWQEKRYVWSSLWLLAGIAYIASRVAGSL
ncbi:MAG TPA: hypothetical protein VG937_04070 [Polyangiaceae bacterium]|nr:hypothetical protein [Polyangiaceae bacterium]